MELIYKIVTILFYVLLFAWAFFYIRNKILAKKLKCLEFYKNLKKDFKNRKFKMCLWIIIIISVIILIQYAIIGIGLMFLSVLFLPIGLTGGSDFYNSLLNYIPIHFELLGYVAYFFLIIVFTIISIALARSIYVNIKCYKKLRSNNITLDMDKEKLQNDGNNEMNTK